MFDNFVKRPDITKTVTAWATVTDPYTSNQQENNYYTATSTQIAFIERTITTTDLQTTTVEVTERLRDPFFTKIITLHPDPLVRDVMSWMRRNAKKLTNTCPILTISKTIDHTHLITQTEVRIFTETHKTIRTSTIFTLPNDFNNPHRTLDVPNHDFIFNGKLGYDYRGFNPYISHGMFNENIRWMGGPNIDNRIPRFGNLCPPHINNIPFENIEVTNNNPMLSTSPSMATDGRHVPVPYQNSVVEPIRFQPVPQNRPSPGAPEMVVSSEVQSLNNQFSNFINPSNTPPKNWNEIVNSPTKQLFSPMNDSRPSAHSNESYIIATNTSGAFGSQKHNSNFHQDMSNGLMIQKSNHADYHPVKNENSRYPSVHHEDKHTETSISSGPCRCDCSRKRTRTRQFSGRRETTRRENHRTMNKKKSHSDQKMEVTNSESRERKLTDENIFSYNNNESTFRMPIDLNNNDNDS